jgi:diguanylate cyclase (GGDEF)-like protein/PAS domain S-box-containing protein
MPDAEVNTPHMSELDRFFSLSLQLLLIARLDDGRIVRCNSAWKARLGWDPNELIGASFFDLIHPDDVEETAAEAARLHQGEMTSYFVNRYRARDGSWRRLAWSAVAASDTKLIYAIGHDVTEQAQIETALRHSERRYRSLTEVSPVGVFHTAPDGHLDYVNERWTEITGLERRSAMGDGWLYPVHPEDRGRIASQWRQSVDQALPFEAEYRLIGADQQQVWVLAQARPDLHASGRLEGFIGTLTDISQQKQTEAALRTGERRLREAERIGGVGSWEFDLKGERLHWSEQLYRIFERDRQRFQPSYQAFLDAVDPEDRDLVEQAYRTSVDNRRPVAIEHRIRVADGHVKWVKQRGETQYADDGMPLRSIGTTQDITDQKHDRIMLAIQARRDEALLELPRLAERLDERAMLSQALTLTEDLTESWIGFAHFVNPDQETIELVAWSKRTLHAGCSATFDNHYPLAQAGIWADALRQRRSVIINDYAARTGGRGLPEGHIGLSRVLVVPVIDDGRVTMLFGVGNKDGEYDRVDLDSAQLLANEAWRLAQRTRAMAQLTLADRVLAETQQGVAITDAEAKLVRVNAAFERITGYRAAEVLGQNPRILQSGRHDATFFRAMWSSLEQHGNWRGEIWNRRKDGAVYPEWLNISAVRDANGQVSHYVAVFSDLSEHKQTQEQIEFLARHDALTGLANRALFGERLEHALSRAEQNGQLAVLHVDIDRFKQINDTLGHDNGDQLLLEVTARMTAELMPSDTLARLGGDEFALLMEQRADTRPVAALARRLLASISEPITLAERELVVTASIGISLYPHDGDNIDLLSRHASQALGAAKQRGRNNFQFFDRQLTEGALERLITEHALRGAVTRNELRLVYQPLVRLSDGQLDAVEALVRWQHPELGLVPPDQFIGLAEEIGVIREIGSWVLINACQQLAAWDRDGFPVPRLAVNLSADQLNEPGLVETLSTATDAAGLAASRLELEVTESMLMRSPEHARNVLEELKRLGAKISIDDFGTGYSSLAVLRLLPLDQLKIDKGFVADINNDSNDEAIVRTIIAMAKTLGLETVAEGIETADQLEYLRRQQVDLGQGYLFAEPLAADALIERWRSRG